MQKTVRLFDLDAYQRTFSARLLSLSKEKDEYAAILDQTLFFPEEAGQSADIGTLNDATVKRVRVKDGVITHYLDKPLPIGEVTGCIDFAHRYRNMQNHTGEHIVSGLFKRLFDFDNFGFHLGHEDVTIDIMGNPTREDLLRVEALANAAIYDNLPIQIHYPTPQEAEGLTYRSKIDIKENIRLVEIPDIDLCACCAPHVKRTGEIGMIKLLDFIRYKGGVRIHMHCGKDAWEDYHRRYLTTSHIAQALSLKQNEVIEGFDKFYQGYESKCAELYEYKRALARETVKHLKQARGILPIFTEQNDPAFIKELGLLAKEKAEYGACVCAKRDEHVYSFMLFSDKLDMARHLPHIMQALSGRGGGRGSTAQGQFSASEEEIIAFFSSFSPLD